MSIGQHSSNQQTYGQESETGVFTYLYAKYISIDLFFQNHDWTTYFWKRMAQAETKHKTLFGLKIDKTLDINK